MSVLELPELEIQYDNFLFYGNFGKSYTVLRLPKLKKCVGYGNWTQAVLKNNSTISRIELPNLKILGVNSTGASIAQDCTALKEVYAPNLTEMTMQNNGASGIVSNSSCTTLRTVVLGRIEKLNPIYLFDRYNKIKIYNMIHFEIGHDSLFPNGVSLISWIIDGAITDINNKNLIEDTSICVNNFEQFLYNFRYYFIDRLYVRSNSTKQYVYLDSSVYKAVLGTDSTGYANTFYMHGESIDYVASLNQKLTDINWGLAIGYF